MKSPVSTRVGDVEHECIQENIFLCMFGRIRVRKDPYVFRGPISLNLVFGMKSLPVDPEGNCFNVNVIYFYLLFTL